MNQYITAHRNKQPNNYVQEIMPQRLQTPEQEEAFTRLRDAMNAPAQTYQGQGVAALPFRSELEESLRSYINRDTPEAYTLAQGHLADTLGGQAYDPSTGQYYQATRDAMQLNLSDAMRGYDRAAQTKGMLTSTPSDVGRARLTAETGNRMNQLLGELALQERQNQLSAVPLAMQLGGAMDRRGLDTIGAVSQVGQQLQQQDQKQADFDYNEWLRGQDQPLRLAELIASLPVTYAYPQYAPTEDFYNQMIQQMQQRSQTPTTSWTSWTGEGPLSPRVTRM